MKRLLIALVFAAGLGSGGEAQDSASEDQPIYWAQAEALAEFHEDLTPEIAHRALEYAYRNIEFVLYHEVAHMLINELELPVLGWEEDAADTLAVAMLLGGNDPGASFKTLRSAALGWFLADQQRGGQFSPEMFYDEHSLDLQRAYHAVCLMVGRDAEFFAELADEAGMPQERREQCVFESERALDSWRSVLDPHRRDGDPAGADLSFTYHEPEKPIHIPLYEVITSEGLLERTVQIVGDEFALPREIRFETGKCPEPSAFFNRDHGLIAICYEMVEQFFIRFAEYGMAQAEAGATE